MHTVPTDILDALDTLHLPPMPQVLLRFLGAMENERAAKTELATLIKQDPALCARFLTAAHAPQLGNASVFRSIEHCLDALGNRLIQVMSSCLAVQSVFGGDAERRPYGLDGFWTHSLQVAELAQDIAASLHYPEREEAYLAGLLHDVGELLLLGGLGDRYGALLNWSRDEQTLVELERPELATTHAEVGAWLVAQWRLPSFMADAILFHHRPLAQIGGTDLLSRIVWTAHTVLLLPEPTADDMITPVALANAADLVGLHADDLQAMVSRARERVAETASCLNIAAAASPNPLPSSPEAPFEQAATAPGNGLDQARLEAVVRDMAVLQPLQKCMSSLESDAELLVALRESMRILFGIGRVGFFLQLPGANVLSGARLSEQAALLQRLEIPLRPGTSLAATTALDRRAQTRFDGEHTPGASLTDLQIARALDCEKVLYLPMIARDRLIGLMALGLTPAAERHLGTRLDWIERYAQVAAASIDTWRTQREREAEIEAAVASRFELHARKVVHEAGNPLAIIRNYLKIVSQKLPPNIEVHQELDILKEEIDRVAQIVRRLSNLSTDASPSATVDINSLIEGMLVLYGESLFASHNISVDLHLGRGIAPLSGNRDSIKQILLNLWKNAADAMNGEGGTFSILTRDGINQNGEMYVEIRLSDTGPGLPEDVLAQLYRPLPGNRRMGHSGLGLSIVASLVEQSRGHITCQTEPGKGTSFSILLPQSARNDA